MTHTIDVSKLAREAAELLSGREYFVSTVLERVRQAANKYPHDGAIRTAQNVLEGRVAKQGSLATISQNDFSEIYREVSGLGLATNFRETLGDLLIDAAPERDAHYNEDFASSLRSSGTELDISDPDMVESLAGLFGEPSNVAKGSFVDNGRKGVELELSSLGFSNPSVEIAARNDKFVVYAAAIESTGGRFAALIPAEVKLGTVLMPSVFVSGSEFVDFNKSNLMAHAQMISQGMRNAEPAKVLSALTANAVSKESFESVTADMSDDIALNSPGLYQSDIEPVRQDMLELEVPNPEVPEALAHLTESMVREALVESGLSYNTELITNAKALVSSELRSMGIPCNKVTVASEFDGGICIAANLTGPGGVKTIEVPVEVVNGRILMPSVFTSGVVAKPFDVSSLKSFASDDNGGKFSAIYSDKYGMSFPDLHDLTLKSASYGNFVDVEECLAVISENYGDQLHKVAFDDLMGLLALGFNDSEESDGMDKYMKEAIDKAQYEEASIKMSSNLMYLLPED